MALMVEILQDALEAEASDVNIWRATRRGQTQRFARDLAQAYASAALEPIPAKEDFEFRPALLSTIEGASKELERDFVAKSLIYAHSVAIADDLALWEALPQKDSSADFFRDQGAISVARRIAYFSELERAGLLYYVDPLPVGQPKLDGLEWEVVRSAAPLVADRAGISHKFADSESAIMPYLSQWLGELQLVLDHADRLKGNIDLFLPDWFAGPELLDWALNANLAHEMELDGSLARHMTATKLLRLPTMGADVSNQISTQDLINLRAEPVFQRWRADLERSLQGVSHKPGPVEIDGLFVQLRHREKELERDLDRSRAMRANMTETLTAGVASGVAGWAFSQSLAVSAASGAAPPFVKLGHSAWRWLLRSSHGEATPYRLFLDQNRRSLTGKIQSPLASTFMYSSVTGRPVLDFMSAFFNEQ